MLRSADSRSIGPFHSSLIYLVELERANTPIAAFYRRLDAEAADRAAALGQTPEASAPPSPQTTVPLASQDVTNEAVQH